MTVPLSVKVDKNINELTKDELKRVLWDELDKNQWHLIDENLYKKLDANGRYNVNNRIYKFEEKPLSYWNEVLKHNDKTGLITLIVNDKRAKDLLPGNESVFMKHCNIPTLIELGLSTFSEIVKSIDKNDIRYSTLFDLLSEPVVEISELFEKYDENTTIIQRVLDVMDDITFTTYIWPVLLPNELLISLNLEPIESITKEVALEEKSYGVDEMNLVLNYMEFYNVDVLSWDVFVSNVRKNKEYNNDDITALINWWYFVK